MSNKMEEKKMKPTAKRELKPKRRFPEFRDAGEWEEKKINQISDLYKGKGVSKSDIVVDGNQPCIRYGELYTSYGEVIDEVISKTNLPSSDLFLSKKNDVIIPASGETKIDIATASCVTQNNVALGGDLNIIRSRQNGIFLSYYLNGILKNKIAKLAQGDTVVHLYATQLELLDIAIPSKPEQQKIADCLSSLDELITAEAQKLDTLKAHKKGLMQQLFPAEGETLPKRRFPEFRDAEEWEAYTLLQVAKFRRGSFPQPYGLPEWYDEFNGMPFIQVFDVGDDLQLKPKTKNKISKLASEQSVFISKGTVIITIQGSIGRVAITQYDAYIDRTLLLFEEFLKPIEKTFFAYVIQLLFEIEKQKAPGGIIKTITKEVLSDFVIRLPSIEEQQKIADCLSSLDELIAAEAQKLDTLKAHKKGLMQQLFPTLDEVNG
jgi:type I restriction enzyme S subunit